ncbi:hypothetical protein ACI2IX_01750 [Leifsonia aquatica]|uniref:hypothetical protein n=1 Tax=Leifsonia aquatica TaxID=144185 RepID=UPI003850095A
MSTDRRAGSATGIPRSGWRREWSLLLILPGAALVATVARGRGPSLPFGWILGVALAAAVIVIVGLGARRLVAHRRLALAAAMVPGAVILEATRSKQSDAILRSLSGGMRPAMWTIVAIDEAGVHWYLEDPVEGSCVFIAAAHVVSLKSVATPVRDGRGGRSVPAILIRVDSGESWQIPLVPRSERWYAPYVYAASASDRDELLRTLRRRLAANVTE